MIEIVDSQILRDGVNIGSIEGGVAYVTGKQAPRIVGQIRAAAGNPDLVVEVMTEEFKREVENLKNDFKRQIDDAAAARGSAPTVKSSLTLEKLLQVKATIEADGKAEFIRLGEEIVLPSKDNDFSPAEIGVTVEVPDVVVNETAQSEKQPVLSVASEKETWDLTGFPDPKQDKQTFRICFVNHYGNDAYGRWRAANA